MRTIGIDPGLSGSLAMLDEDGLLLELIDMPTLKVTKTRRAIDVREFAETIEAWTEGEVIPGHVEPIPTRVVIERAMVMPGQGSSSGFKTGRGFGQIEGVLIALRIQHEDVTPQKWQGSILGKIPKGTSKDHARAFAQKRFPHADLGKRKTQDRSDALCIAEYGRRQELAR